MEGRGTKRGAGDDPNRRDLKKAKEEQARINRIMLLPPGLREEFLLGLDLVSLKRMCMVDQALRAFCRARALEDKWYRIRTNPLFGLPMNMVRTILAHITYDDLINLEDASPLFKRVSRQRHFRHHWVMENIPREHLWGGPFSPDHILTPSQATAAWAVYRFERNGSFIFLTAGAGVPVEYFENPASADAANPPLDEMARKISSFLEESPSHTIFLSNRNTRGSIASIRSPICSACTAPAPPSECSQCAAPLCSARCLDAHDCA